MEAIKEKLTKAPTLAFFDARKDTVLWVDASPVGLGAVLQKYGKSGEARVVAYASRSLSEVERRYSQLEREALAIAWGCKRF